jgi:hypothetical protein
MRMGRLGVRARVEMAANRYSSVGSFQKPEIRLIDTPITL